MRMEVHVHASIPILEGVSKSQIESALEAWLDYLDLDAIDEVKPQDYQALLIPGGQSPDHLRADPRVVQFVKAFDALKRPIAAVCHGPQLLLSARLVKGRTLTAWKTVQDDLEQAGAKVLDQPVVIDQNWITSRKPEDLEKFSEALIQALQKEERKSTNGARA